MNRLTDFRHVFAQAVVSKAGCCNPETLRAFSTVARHEFVGPGPWYLSQYRTPTLSADPALVYQDSSVAIAGVDGIPTGLPSLHARCLEACAPGAGERVAHIGCGAGYFTAILAFLVGPAGAVDAFEIHDTLVRDAVRNLQRWPWVQVSHASGVRAMPEPMNVIYASAGVQQLPLEWLDSLAIDGRLVVPLAPTHGEGAVFLVRRMGSRRIYAAEVIAPARFVPCIGTVDADLGHRLASAFARDEHHRVRSLRLGVPVSAKDAWIEGKGWFLSFEALDHRRARR